VSIRGRLTLWYTLVLAIVLMLYAGGAYAFLSHRLRAELDRTLRTDFEAAEELARGGMPRTDHDHQPQRWIEVRDEDGALIVREGPDVALPRTAMGVSSATLANGDRVRILSGRYVVSGDLLGHPERDLPVLIRIARSEARLRHELGEFLLGMGIALPLAVALASVAGYFLARRGLAPVDRIVDRAREITVDRLTEQLPVKNPGDELGRLATTFNETFARLQRSFSEMKRFTGDAAHELRTPLTVLRSVGEVCLRDPASDARHAIGSMLEEVERMTRLVDGLLRLARADGAAEVAKLQPVDLAAFARALVERLGITAPIEADEAVMVNADPDLLGQALANVLDNAVRHSPDFVEVSVRAPGTIEVIDHGDGIAPEHMDRIFDRFYRADEARARDAGGAGLGLAIARWAVEAQGGRIEVESQPGEGATFRITLA